MSKEVAKKQKQEVVVAPEAVGSWGSENLDSKDMIVPKLLVMQGMSKLVTDGVAMVGQIRESIEGNLLGGIVKPKEMQPIEVIFFGSFKTWVVYENENGMDQYKGTVPFSVENQDWQLNEVVDGVAVRRDKTLNFYCLTVADIKAGMVFPYVVSFRRTSMPAGKKLATIAKKLSAFNKPMAYKVFNLGVEMKENDKGKFFVPTIEATRDSTEAELKEAYKWHLTMKSASVKVDDSDLKAEVDTNDEGIEF